MSPGLLDCAHNFDWAHGDRICRRSTSEDTQSLGLVLN